MRIRLTWELLDQRTCDEERAGENQANLGDTEPIMHRSGVTSGCCGAQIGPLQLPVPLNRTAPNNSRGHISAVPFTAICLRIIQEYLATQTRRYFETAIALATMQVCWLFGCGSEVMYGFICCSVLLVTVICSIVET